MNPEREALLLSRIVDRMADDTDFDQIGRIASEDPGVWERLGLTLRDDASLRGALSSAVAACPVELALPAPRSVRSSRRLLRLVGAGLVAGLAFAAGHLTGRAPAGTVPSTADQLFAEYVRVGADQGRVLEQLPMVPVASHPAQDGRTMEVVFVRRLLERAVVDKAFRLGTDEHGRVTPAEVNLAAYRTPSSF
jgi:hypothetical protein